MKIKQYDFEKIAQRIKAVRKDRNITQAHVLKNAMYHVQQSLNGRRENRFPN